MIKIDCDVLLQSVMGSKCGQTLRFASLASTLLVIFEEWQKGTQQNTVVGKNVIRTLDILRDCRRKLILFAFRSQEGFGTI